MRAIALAIFLGSIIIRGAILKAAKIPEPDVKAAEWIMGIILIAFIISTIGGW